MNSSTYIAEISYQVENWLHEGKGKQDIIGELTILQKKENSLLTFPMWAPTFYWNGLAGRSSRIDRKE